MENCTVFEQNKIQAKSPAGLLQLLPIPNQIWDNISRDLIERLPWSYSYDSVLMVFDRLSKYAHFLALTHSFTAKTIASLFMCEIVQLHGIPRTIVSLIATKFSFTTSGQISLDCRESS